MPVGKYFLVNCTSMGIILSMGETLVEHFGFLHVAGWLSLFQDIFKQKLKWHNYNVFLYSLY